MRFKRIGVGILLAVLLGCAHAPQSRLVSMPNGLPPLDPDNAIYEVPVNAGLSHQDVVDSLKSVSQGMNFVTAANFNIAEQIKKRDIDPQGVKEVYAICNLSLGIEIMLDHPEFTVFAPCRLALYEKQGKLFLGLDRPTFDLKNIRNPTERAKKSAQELESKLIELMGKASKGDI